VVDWVDWVKVSSPLSTAGEDRSVERSKDRVSKSAGSIGANARRIDSPDLRFAGSPSLWRATKRVRKKTFLST